MDLVEDEASQGGCSALEVEERFVMSYGLDPFVRLELACLGQYMCLISYRNSRGVYARLSPEPKQELVENR